MRKTSKTTEIIKTTVATAIAAALSLCFISCTTPPSDIEPPDTDTSVTEPAPEDPPLWASNFDLPDADTAMSELGEIYGSSDKIFLLQNGRIARMPCPQGERISLNMTYDIDDHAKLVLQDCVDEFNEIFDVINPNYEFVVNYAPTDDDLKAKYSVRMTHAQTLSATETSFALGMAHVSYYANFTELGDFGIVLKDEVLTNGSYLMTTFKHELMHLLGAGDAYKNPAATEATVMQSYTVNGYHHLSQTDVAFLAALYRNPDCPFTDAQVDDYILNYETSTTHTKTNMTAAVYFALVKNAEPSDIAAQVDAKGYAEPDDFKAAASAGLNPDPDFGKTSISFTELAYAEPRSETYFGKFDVANNKYWHGRQSGTSGSSFGIGYTDYGNGLLFAMPNGTAYKTLFIRMNDHVVLLHLNGSFTSLDEMSLSVRHLCDVN